MRELPLKRPAAYDYRDRYGHSKVWRPVIAACVSVWSDGKQLAFHHLIPYELKITKRAKRIASKKELLAYLSEQVAPGSVDASSKRGRRNKSAKPRPRYGSREGEEIAASIETVFALIKPIETALLSKELLSGVHIADFVKVLQAHVRDGTHWRSEAPADLIARAVGLSFMETIFTHAPEIAAEHAEAMVSLVSDGRFTVHQKIRLLEQLSRHPAHHSLAGRFAQHVSEQIRQDENIGSRGEMYADLAAALVPMSVDEAKEYYRQGLAQLDQMGGEDYQQIYSLLQYAATQPGGFLEPALAQRLMNLCQVIADDDPGKFGWTLFGRAASRSIGVPAIAKLVRWNNQDVAQLSYGLPQLACFLAKAGHLSPKRAAFLVTICEDNGWRDWQVGEGVGDLLSLADTDARRRIVQAVLAKLRSEHQDGGWPALWKSILTAADKYPGVLSADEQDMLRQLRDDAQRRQDEFNSRSTSSPDFLNISYNQPDAGQLESALANLTGACDPTSAASIDEMLKNIRENKRLPFGADVEFVRRLAASCPYNKKLDFLFAICDTLEWEFDRSVDTLIECVSDWRGSIAHLASNTTRLVARLIESKGSALVDEGYSSLLRRIQHLSEFCGNKRFVLDQVLQKIAADEIELDGDEWLQLATSLCDIASGIAARSALELILSSSASRIADEIGEGAHRPQQEILGDEACFFSDVLWHLLGDDDAFVRWNLARGIRTLVDLGLQAELGLLLDRFDADEIPALASKGRQLSFQNSQEWLLIGLARAALHYGPALAFLRPRLIALAVRDDVHVMHKVHIARCLENIGNDGKADTDLLSLRTAISAPRKGIVVSDEWPTYAEAKSGFEFDYEFNKSEIEPVARMFRLPQGVVVDALAAEIVKRWPEAQNLDYFSGHDRYRRDRYDRYEYFREHIQKHALFGAVTKLAETTPIFVREYEVSYASPWLEWQKRYDITFRDGSWLSDRKNSIPKVARDRLLGPRNGKQETLQGQDALLMKIGLVTADRNVAVPLYGRWSSPDGVSVKIVTALTEPSGAIGRCCELSKRASHDLWLPELWDEGFYDLRFREKSIFEPLIWAPESHSLGIDQGDKIAAHSAASRPRLGIAVTKRLAVSEGPVFGEWHAPDGSLALKSQVWGSWQLDRDMPNCHHHEDGEILWAWQEWLDAALRKLNRRLVYTIEFWKYGSSREYDKSIGAKSVLVGMRSAAGQLRLWPAKKAS